MYSGHILTNYHVVGGATKISVLLADGREFSGKSIKTIGTDPKTDLASFRSWRRARFHTFPWETPTKWQLGQWVVAIGHPRGLE